MLVMTERKETTGKLADPTARQTGDSPVICDPRRILQGILV